MSSSKDIRTPQQKRSVQKKQLIIDTAKSLFCDKGYHQTTTNEIAKEAGVSIGTVYSYFADKETILLDLLDQYNGYFLDIFQTIDTDENATLFKESPQEWFHLLVKKLVELHEPQVDFYRELEVLYYSNDKVAALMDNQNERVRAKTQELMDRYQENFAIEDTEIASLLAVDFVTALVDRIVFKSSPAHKDRILNFGVEAICQALSRG